MRVLICLAPTPQPLVKVSVKENEVPTEKILVARVFSLQRKVIYQIKAKRLNYLIKDFILSNFKRRLSFLLSNSEVSSLLLKLQPFRVVKYLLALLVINNICQFFFAINSSCKRSHTHESQFSTS